MDAQVESNADATAAENAGESEEQAKQRRARRGARKQAPATLESQDDLGYVTGQHKAGEEDKQIRSPESQRSHGQANEPTQGNAS